MTTLSVVLISKNQENNIGRLITSVLEHTAKIPNTEIVLVDSDSTDRTTELACQYPIRVIQLSPGQQLTASTGRYVGTQVTQGEYILFLDGDMALYPGWLERAFTVLAQEPDVAGLTGQLLELPTAAEPTDSPTPHALHTNETRQEIAHTGGASLMRRAVLEEVGTFFPYVYSDEEPELCLRIRHHGYRLLRLPYPIAYHYSDPIHKVSTLFQRRKRRLWHGSGQLLRLHAGTPYFWPYMRERGHGLQAGLALIVMLAAGLTALRQRAWTWLLAGHLGLAGILLRDARRKGGLYATAYSLILRGMVLDGTLRGLLLPPLKPDEIPVQYKILQSDERILT
jgi:glycosyltransferase involved in cell wall biosynthesis